VRLRRAAVQGRLSRWGSACLLASFLVAVLAATEASDGAPWPALLGLAVVLALLGVVQLVGERRLRAAVLAGFEAQLAGHDPGPSPVPWLSDAVWREWNSVTPEAALLEERYAGAFPDPSPPPAVADPHVRLVRDEERERATRADPDAPVPEAGEPDELTARLAETPGRPGAYRPVWPACCERPATLLAPDAGALGQDGLPGGVDEVLYLPDAEDEATGDGPMWLRPEAGGVRFRLPDEEVFARAEEAGDVQVFQCRACGRLYAAPGWTAR